MPLYFAYGANMDVADMARRAPGSKPLGLARLPRHRFVIAACGYASVIRDPRAEVHGMLWDLALSDLRPLDRFEEVDRGLYVKINQPVISAGGPKRALIYVATAADPGLPRTGYLEAVLKAAEAIGLPAPYRADLARWGKGVATRVAQTEKPALAKNSGAAARASDAWSWDG